MNHHRFLRRWFVLILVTYTLLSESRESVANNGPFFAGAAVVDVSPVTLPIAVNGGMTASFAQKVNAPIHARAIVLSDGDVQAAIVVVDSCMMPRSLIDDMKEMAAKKTGIASTHQIISATHTHTAPASMSCLGTDADPEYQAYLRIKVVEAIEAAKARLAPAKVGWGSIDAANYMAVRRWILRPDRMGTDPFGNRTMRANMHAGRNWDDVTGESGPEDPELSLIAIQSIDGQPIAVLANLSMHYFSGVEAISPDYFGAYCDRLQKRLADKHRQASGNDSETPIVGIMSHGCSGDIWRMDYTKQTPSEFESITIDKYTEGLLDLTMQAYEQVKFSETPTLRVAEQRLPLKYRTPNVQLLEWSRRIVEAMGDRLPKTVEEVYAREQLYLHEAQSTEVVVQALSLGDIAIATTPTETYALTGMKIKLQSPLAHTMVFDLAGGGDGYIPPPEQHRLGGYNTWPARSAGLEVDAEPKIVESALSLLEMASGLPRKVHEQTSGPECDRINASDPLGYWRLDDFSGPRAKDSSRHHRDAIYEPGVVFFLEGARSDLHNLGGQLNRASHFVGGRLRANVGTLPDQYTVSLWIWNGIPIDAREVTGWFYSRGRDFGRAKGTELLGVGGTLGHAGKLVLQIGDGPLHGGTTSIERWRWHHVRMVRTGDNVQVFLDDRAEPEISVTLSESVPHGVNELFFGGSSEGQFNWEGRLDEIAVFGLSAGGKP